MKKTDDIESITNAVNELLTKSAQSDDPANAEFCIATAHSMLLLAILRELKALRADMANA